MWERFFYVNSAIEIFSWQWIVSQVLLAILIVGIIIGWQQKDKVKLMTWQVGFNFLSAAANIFLLNWIAVAIGIAGGLRQLAFIYVELKKRSRLLTEQSQTQLNIQDDSKETLKKNAAAKKKEFYFGLSVFLIFSIINIVTIYFTMQNYYGFVIMAARIAVNFAMWKGSTHAIKIVAALIWPAVMIINQLMFFSFVGMLKEIITITTIIIFYIRFFHKKRIIRKIG
ncbi:MAG: YgjV family protein [Firmicutes bacterium]|nr:YgjV family protein [Bacillota bacterium]